MFFQNSHPQIMGEEQDEEKGDVLCADQISPVFSFRDILPSVF